MPLDACLELGFASNNIYKYILSRLKNVDYSVTDISQNILNSLPKSINAFCIDHDNWNFEKDQFNLILSNLYLHLTNNMDILLNNISYSLKKNGFFIASIPSSNCIMELKDVMLSTDINIYGGAYKRFSNNFTIQLISNLLKKNNFKDSLIEIDTIDLKYENFEKLLYDMKHLGSGYLLNDRKKTFERKEYFKKAEEIYWDKFSKNNKLNLTFEILFFSGWK